MKPSTTIFSALALLLAGTTLAGQLDTRAWHARAKLKPVLSKPQILPSGVARFGDPLAGLDTSTLQAFAQGREEFMSVETAEGGLGPIFNGSSCVACHSAGGTGGASALTVTRFGRRVDGQFDPLDALGGSLLQHSAIAPEALERVPAEANVVALRLATPLFGAGLIEAIPDETIVQNAQRRHGDGVSGRVAMVTDIVSGKSRVGRFGWKAQQASLLAFSADAYLNEMGITSRFQPVENAPNGNAALLARFDHVPDVEDAVDPATGKSDIDHAADFMRLLAPPPPVRASASSLAGAKLFEQAKCSACHTPVMFTGANVVPALSFAPVPLYSDLLLHNMGSLGDRIEQAAARGAEMRTAPLWGLRARAPYLHDGRAATVTEAIRAHDGEAAASRERFKSLGAAEKRQLLDFLNTI